MVRVGNGGWCRARVLGRAALGVWFVGVAVTGATLLASHLLPVPVAARGASPADVALLGLRRVADEGRPLVVHVLAAECRCSRRIAESLLGRPAVEGRAEHVVLVGDDPELERRLDARGIPVTRVDRGDLTARFGVASAPVFFVASATDRPLYLGGYTDRKQGYPIRDREIVEAALSGARPAPLPVYGCAVDDDVRAERSIVSLGSGGVR